MRCFIKLKYFLLDFIIIIHITYERLKLRGEFKLKCFKLKFVIVN